MTNYKGTLFNLQETFFRRGNTVDLCYGYKGESRE